MAKKQETEQSARPPVFFIFLLLKVFLLFYSFTFLLLNHSPPQLSTSSSVSPGVSSFTLKLSKVLWSWFTTLALFMQTSSIRMTLIAGVIYSFFILLFTSLLFFRSQYIFPPADLQATNRCARADRRDCTRRRHKQPWRWRISGRLQHPR